MPCRLVWALLLPLSPALVGQQYPFIPVANSPRNIEHILQDRQGRLWMSTHDDVLCFDGARFFSLHEFGLPALLSEGLAEDTEGGILSASRSGVYRFFQGHLEHVSDMPVAEAIGVAPGVLFAAAFPNRQFSLARFFRIRLLHGAWISEELAGWTGGSYLSRDNSGAVLFVCPGGWCEAAAKLIVDWTPQRPTQRILHKSELDMHRVVRDRFGCVWFRSIEAGAYQCPGREQPVRLPAEVAGRNVWAAEGQSDDGSMVFANVASLAAGRPGAFQVANPTNGLPAEAVTCAVRARDGSIWAGSINGLYRFPFPFRMAYWKSRHGLVWSFARAGDRMLAGTSAGVAYLSKAGDWTVLKGSREFGSITSVLPDRQGNIYAAVAREAVIQLRPNGSLAARTPPGRGGQAAQLARAADGTIWLAGAGIYRVHKKASDLSLEADNPADRPPSDARVTVNKPGGELLACYAGGPIRKETGTWRRMAISDGLLERSCISLAVQPNGDIWLGYIIPNAFAFVQAGRVNRARVWQHEQDEGEIGAPVSYFFGVDTRGWIWRGSNDGIHIADPAQGQAGVWLQLNEADGLTDPETNRNSFYSDSDGSVWWAAQGSIVHFYPPPDLVHPAGPPPVFVSAFSVSGAAPRLAESIREFPNGKKLSAHAASLQFERRNALRVRYRLLPKDVQWRESRALDLDLGTPPWGTHTLELQSRFSMGQWSGTLSKTFVVLRPWWFSWQAMLGFAGIGFSGAAGGAAWRRKQRARASLPDLAEWRLAALSPESQWVGTTLDQRYEILSLVARGGFASVLKGRDLRDAGRPCAIKIFRHDVIDEKWRTHRFQQEVSALEKIRHPSVISIYGHGVTPDGAPYLAMEFIEGGTLRDLLHAGPLPLGRTASILRQVASALEQIHARGIYHRDLKPENLMIREGSPPGEELVLIDFSIAIVQEPDQTIHGLSRAAGTIYYMAPEQAVGFAMPASDVYSLAKILLEMLTGQKLTTLLPDASLDLPDRVREFARGLPIPFSEQSVELLGSALEFDPTRRPQDARLFADPIVRDLSGAGLQPAH